MEQRCENCLFWLLGLLGLLGGTSWGNCRHNAPAALNIVAGNEPLFVAAWPQTRNDQWCPRPVQQKAEG